jgi:hypothetical protein
MYCGKAAAAKDLAYFCNVQLPPSDEEQLLLHYHAVLTKLLQAQGDTPPRYFCVRTPTLSCEILNTSSSQRLCPQHCIRTCVV